MLMIVRRRVMKRPRHGLLERKASSTCMVHPELEVRKIYLEQSPSKHANAKLLAVFPHTWGVKIL